MRPIGREGGGGIAQRGRSLLSTIALLLLQPQRAMSPPSHTIDVQSVTDARPSLGIVVVKGELRCGALPCWQYVTNRSYLLFSARSREFQIPDFVCRRYRSRQFGAHVDASSLLCTLPQQQWHRGEQSHCHWAINGLMFVNPGIKVRSNARRPTAVTTNCSRHRRQIISDDRVLHLSERQKTAHGQAVVRHGRVTPVFVSPDLWSPNSPDQERWNCRTECSMRLAADGLDNATRVAVSIYIHDIIRRSLVAPCCRTSFNSHWWRCPDVTCLDTWYAVT